MEIPGERAFRQGNSMGEGHDEEMSWCIRGTDRRLLWL